MRKMATRTRTSEYRYVSELRCDICGARGHQAGPWEDSAWSASPFEVSKTSLFSERGSAYPDGGGHVETIAADICNACFEKHIVPFLESLGVECRREETES